MKTLVRRFALSVARNKIEIYNEFSLQHEFGLFLRNVQRNSKVQFERNVSYFFPGSQNFLKKEMDLAVFSQNKKVLYYAIELKYPRNGQYPEQMYSFCKDIAFIEQLKRRGFREAYFIAFADDPLFYRGNGGGIYDYFRKGEPLTGVIHKPTGTRNQSVRIAGKYKIVWEPVKDELKIYGR